MLPYILVLFALYLKDPSTIFYFNNPVPHMLTASISLMSILDP